jgi:HSP20 family protein
MSELILWKNQEINKLRKDLDRLFTRLSSGFGAPLIPAHMGRGPIIDLSETEDTLILKAELPGIRPDDLDISVSDDRLTISGERSEERVEEDRHYHRIERRFGSFARTVRLPCKVEIEQIEATYKKGVLQISMPKCKADKQRDIKIQVK